MGFFFFPVICGIFYVVYHMMKLSIAIAKERHPDKKQETTVWKELLSGGSLHMWIGPYFSEHGDSTKVIQLIRLRNQWVAIFWGIMILSLIVSLVYHKLYQS